MAAMIASIVLVMLTIMLNVTAGHKRTMPTSVTAKWLAVLNTSDLLLQILTLLCVTESTEAYLGGAIR